MRVKMIKNATLAIDGLAVARYLGGRVYDCPAPVGALFVSHGFALGVAVPPDAEGNRFGDFPAAMTATVLLEDGTPAPTSPSR